MRRLWATVGCAPACRDVLVFSNDKSKTVVDRRGMCRYTGIGVRERRWFQCASGVRVQSVQLGFLTCHLFARARRLCTYVDCTVCF